ncbi:MAG: hypothetical protein PWQ15_794 [Methanobacterium sp.]|jgi:hypothetical protein|nr:hypothetical protein [Methanobacterium sp.]
MVKLISYLLEDIISIQYYYLIGKVISYLKVKYIWWNTETLCR